MQSRQLIRRAVRQNSKAQVVVLGCYPQIASDEVAAISGVTHILGTTEKLALLEHISQTRENTVPRIYIRDARKAGEPSPLAFSRFANRTRAFLKVQDGCDAYCSYCIVPYARGCSRSISLESIISQVERFLDNGYQEIVLTGIHLGQWGLDLNPPQKLVALLRSILDRCPPPRLRLSSLEPGEITPNLLEMMATEPALCPHLHIPLQSGDARVLNRMNRHYQPEFYRELVLEVTRRIPNLAAGADVLVGFPGETDECFQNTYDLIESLPISYLHIFPYSSRPGTPAATMTQQVSSSHIRRRCRLLKELDKEKRLAFMQQFLGKLRPVLVENRRDEASGMYSGFSDNYLPVLVQTDSALENHIVRVRLERLQGKRLLGTPT